MPLVIIGASGNARSVFAIAHAMNQAEPDNPPWHLMGFIDDGVPDLEPIRRLGVDVIGTSADMARFHGAHYTIGVGNAQTKRRLVELADQAGLQPATLIHPTAVIDPGVELGLGSTVSRLTVVMTNVRVGRHTTLAPQASLAHDCRVGDFAFVAQGAILAGGVSVGDDTFIGAGSMCRQGVHVADGAIVGMGSVVIRDVPAKATVVGIPARELADPSEI